MSANYTKHKADIAARRRQLSEEGRDIAPIPKVVDKARREQCCKSFQAFCEKYLPERFNMTWSPDHITAIDRIEQAVIQGGLFALAMPRGSGKTSLCEAAVLWSLLNAHRKFVFVIGSDASAAGEILESIRIEIEVNDTLLEDYPEVCYPIRSLEGINNRAGGQTCNGNRTYIKWTRDKMTFPCITGSASSGSVVRVAGITGRIRGAKHTDALGESKRPDLVIVDDPQTDESARSPAQCMMREKVLNGAVLGLAGPGKKISGIMPCTVIYPNDMADTLLDRKKSPEWNGQRTRMVYAFPTNEKLWEQYAKIRTECLEAGDTIKRATQFYAENKEEMDAGSRVAWPERFNVDELSALQHAMNLKLHDEAMFQSEYQNDPMLDQDVQIQLTADDVLDRLSQRPRGLVPAGSELLTAFVDVQKRCLWWMVCAWEGNFTGHILDYGAFPDQRRQNFTMNDVGGRTTLQAHYGENLEGAIYGGLEALVERLSTTLYIDETKEEHSVSQILIDANWGESTDIVYQFCRDSKQASPAHGRYIGASSMPFQQWKKGKGDRAGMRWLSPVPRRDRAIRHVLFDANFYKSFVHERLATPRGAPGYMDIFGDKRPMHRMLANHITSEIRKTVAARGRTVDEWELPKTKPDNHLLDCLVGCAVGASMGGVTLLAAERKEKQRRQSERKRKRVSYMEG